MKSSPLPRLLLRRSAVVPQQPCPSARAAFSQPSRPEIRPRSRQQHHLRSSQPRTSSRSFHLPQLSSLFNNNSNNNNPSPARTLTAVRVLPYPPAPLFRVVASVESYSQFLPFLTESTVTARDPKTGYPTRAFLTVGYGPLSETFTSRVDCDPENWVVEARSGADFAGQQQQQQSSSSSAADGEPFPGADEGVFDHLSTRWELVPLETEAGRGRGPQTRVQLQIRFQFRNPLHTAMMSAVEEKMAAVMIEAFEKRIREVEGPR
ncbi:hypothetical protein VTN02DRAFT_5287 [Thermoascus thermophilus]